MEQPSTRTALNRTESDSLPDNPADLLANVRSLADCLEDWAARRPRAIPIPPVVVEPRIEAGEVSHTIHQEQLPC